MATSSTRLPVTFTLTFEVSVSLRSGQTITATKRNVYQQRRLRRKRFESPTPAERICAVPPGNIIPDDALSRFQRDITDFVSVVASACSYPMFVSVRCVAFAVANIWFVAAIASCKGKVTGAMYMYIYH